MTKKKESVNYISAAVVGWCLLATLVGCIVLNVVTYNINKYRFEDAVSTLTKEQIKQDAKVDVVMAMVKMYHNKENKKVYVDESN